MLTAVDDEIDKLLDGGVRAHFRAEGVDDPLVDDVLAARQGPVEQRPVGRPPHGGGALIPGGERPFAEDDRPDHARAE